MTQRTFRDRIGGNRVIVQIIAIVAGAALTFFAGWQYSDASSAWQEAIRMEVALAGVHQDDVRRVYANEGPYAFRVAALDVRAEALAPLADKNAAAATQRSIARTTVFALRQAADPGTLLGERRYDLPDGGSNLSRRLADVAGARGPAPDPDAPDREGDGLALLAGWTAAITAVITGTAVVGACVRRPRRSRRSRRRSARSQDPAAAPLEFYPQPGAVVAQNRRVAFLLLAVWAAGVLLPLIQLFFSSQEQRYQAESARHAVQARSAKSISLTRTEFVVTARQIAQELSVAAIAREAGASYQGSEAVADAGELAGAEENAAVRSAALVDAMARAPAPADGVEAGLATRLSTEQHDWDVLTARSTWETKKADAASLVSNILLGVIGLVVLVEAVVQLIVTGRRRAPARR